MIPEAFFYFLFANFEARSGESRIAEPKNETLWSNNNLYFAIEFWRLIEGRWERFIEVWATLYHISSIKYKALSSKVSFERITVVSGYIAKLQNTLPLICISLNKKSDYCYIPRSSKHTDTCKWSGHEVAEYSAVLQKLRQEKRSTGSDQRIATRICIIASKELLFKIIDLYVTPWGIQESGRTERKSTKLFYSSADKKLM